MRPVVAAFDKRDFDDATRGKLAELNDPLVKAADGRIVWDTRKFDFLKGETPVDCQPQPVAPAAAEPCAGPVQGGRRHLPDPRLAGMTLVEGHTGWIVIDTMLTAPMARAGFKLAMDT
jgi:alkyl sulfatase BDS1-like metallo-beta-lactamase superfamily hydrolase